MHCLLIAENWPPRVGGIEKYLTNISQQLQHLPGIDVSVIAPNVRNEKKLPITSRPPTGDRPAGLASQLSVTRKRFFWPLIRPKWLPLFIFIYRLVKRENVEVVLCGKALFEGLAGYYLKKHAGIPYVVFTYAMEIEEWASQPATRRKLERVLRQADRVICINEVTRKKLLNLGVTEERLKKIYPGVEEHFFKPPENLRVLKKYNVARPYILTVARLIPRKGLDDLIEAFAHIDQVTYPDVQLVIVGAGYDRERLKKIAEREFIRPLFLGNVPDEDLAALYAQAELFALTPKAVAGDIEGFGIVYLEAGAAGIPVIGTRTGGVPEAIVHQKTGLLVEAGNRESIKNALERLLSNHQEAAALAVFGRERARQHFNWEKQVKLLTALLRDIAV
jgi:phosphatidyl-myo-inositol dimannoside synthase